jgi:hypothetical protein
MDEPGTYFFSVLARDDVRASHLQRLTGHRPAFLFVDPPAQHIGKTVAVPQISAFQSAIAVTGSTRLGASMQVTGTDWLRYSFFQCFVGLLRIPGCGSPGWTL